MALSSGSSGSFSLLKDPSLVNLTVPHFSKSRLRRNAQGGFDPNVTFGMLDPEGNRGIFADGSRVGTTTGKNFFENQAQGFGSFDDSSTFTTTSQSQNGELVGDFGTGGAGGVGGSTAIPDDGAGTPVASVTPVTGPTFGVEERGVGDIEARLKAVNDRLNTLSQFNIPQGSPLAQALASISQGGGTVTGFRDFSGPSQGLTNLFGDLDTGQGILDEFNQFKAPAGITGLNRSLQDSQNILAEIAGGSFAGGSAPGQGQLGEALRLSGILGDDLGGIVPDLNQNIIPEIGRVQGLADTLGTDVGGIDFSSPFMSTLQNLTGPSGEIAGLAGDIGDLGFDQGFLQQIGQVLPDQIGAAQRNLDTLGATAGGVGFDSDFLRTLAGLEGSQGRLADVSGLAGNVGFDQGFLDTLNRQIPNQFDTIDRRIGGVDERLRELGFEQPFLDQLTGVQGDVTGLGNDIRDLGIDRLTGDVNITEGTPFDDSQLQEFMQTIGPEIIQEITGGRGSLPSQLQSLNLPGLIGGVGEDVLGVGGQVGDLQKFLTDEFAKLGPGSGAPGTGGTGATGTDNTQEILDLLRDMQLPAGTEVAPGGIFGSVETALEKMLGGPTTAEGLREDPLTASILADLEESNRRRELEDREQLNRMGVLRGGDNIRLGDRRADDQSRAELAALGDAAERFRSDRTTGVTAGTQLGTALSNREIAIGELLGEIGGEQTLGGRQADLDVIGSIIAALDPAVDFGTENDKQLGFASSLLDLLNLPPDQIAKIRTGLGI